MIGYDNDCRSDYQVDRDSFEPPIIANLYCEECGVEVGYIQENYNGDKELEYTRNGSDNLCGDTEETDHYCAECWETI